MFYSGIDDANLASIKIDGLIPIQLTGLLIARPIETGLYRHIEQVRSWHAL